MHETLRISAFAALSLSAAIAPLANAATYGGSSATSQQGPYDNTANSLDRNTVGGQ
jgi:hypothetical protein